MVSRISTLIVGALMNVIFIATFTQLANAILKKLNAFHLTYLLGLNAGRADKLFLMRQS